MKHACSKCEMKNNKDEKKALIKIDITKVGCESEVEVTIEGDGNLIHNGLVALFNGLKKSPDTCLMLIAALMEAGLNE